MLYFSRKSFPEVSFSSALKRFGECQPKILEQSWSKLSKLLLISRKSSSKVFFLSYQKQFEQFGEHRSKFFEQFLSKTIKLLFFSGERTSKVFFSSGEKLFGEHPTSFSDKSGTKLGGWHFSHKIFVQKVFYQVKSSLGNIRQKFFNPVRVQ